MTGTILSVANPAGAFLVQIISPKILIGIGNLLGVAALSLSTTISTFTSFLFFYTSVFGTGIGLCYFAPLVCGWEWVSERRGLVTGLIMGAFGCGAFMFSLISQAVVNPDNEPAYRLDDGTLIFEPEIAARVSCFILNL